MDYKHKNPRPVQYKEREVILFQRVEGGYVERHFISWMKLAVAKEKYGCEESARIFLRHGKERTSPKIMPFMNNTLVYKPI